MAAAERLHDHATEEEEEEQDIREMEIAHLKQAIPEHCVATCTPHLITVNAAATPYRKLGLRIIFPEHFPETTILPEVSSDTLPQVAVNKLNEVAAKQAKETEAGHQCAQVASTLRQILMSNKMLYCIDELKDIKAIDKEKITVKSNEEKGTVRVRMTQGNYYITWNITVPEQYPEVAPQFEVGSSNFPAKVTKQYLLQLETVLKRCEAGFSPDVALSKSGLMQAAPRVKTKAEDVVHVTADHMRDLKKDVRFLHETSQLQSFASQKKASNSHEYAHSAKERKEVRRKLKKMTKEEAAAEEARLKKIEEELEAEAKALSIRPTNQATRSLYVAVNFLANDFVFYLPTGVCKLSEKPLLPDDPEKAKKYVEDANHSKHPVRMACGHWFLLKPMDEHIRSPPFVHYCPHCGERLCQTRWEADPKKLEKAWSKEQEKYREMNEVTNFLELSDEFAHKQETESRGQFTEDD